MSSYGCESVTQGRICDQNHGTPSDPQQVVCGASLVGELCQLCPYHIVCDGGGDVYLPNRGTFPLLEDVYDEGVGRVANLSC